MASKGFEPKGRDPYRHQPIPKGKVEWACKQTLSIMSASRLLGVTYNTMKKYAQRYTDENGVTLFDKYKNPTGKGIARTGNTGFNAKLTDIFEGKHPNYPHWKLSERLILNGYLKQECSNCGYEDYRESDMMGPYLLYFLDGDNRNYDIDNLTLLCFNCFYLLKKPDMKSITTPRSIKLIQKKLTEVFDEN